MPYQQLQWAFLSAGFPVEQHVHSLGPRRSRGSGGLARVVAAVARAGHSKAGGGGQLVPRWRGQAARAPPRGSARWSVHWAGSAGSIDASADGFVVLRLRDVSSNNNNKNQSKNPGRLKWRHISRIIYNSYSYWQKIEKQEEL